MKVKIDKVEISYEEMLERAAAFHLDKICAFADKMDLCPVCLVEMMHDMMTEAVEQGNVEHSGGKSDDGKEPTHSGTRTPQ